MRKLIYSMMVAGALMFAATGCEYDSDDLNQTPTPPEQEEPGEDPGEELVPSIKVYKAQYKVDEKTGDYIFAEGTELTFEETPVTEVNLVGDYSAMQQYLLFETENLDDVEVEVAGAAEWLTLTKRSDNIAHLLAEDFPFEGADCTLEFKNKATGDVITSVKVVVPNCNVPFEVRFVDKTAADMPTWHFRSDSAFSLSGDIDNPDWKPFAANVVIKGGVDGNKKPTYMFFEKNNEDGSLKKAEWFKLTETQAARASVETLLYEVVVDENEGLARQGVVVFLPYDSTASEADVIKNVEDYRAILCAFDVLQEPNAEFPAIKDVENWNSEDCDLEVLEDSALTATEEFGQNDTYQLTFDNFSTTDEWDELNYSAAVMFEKRITKYAIFDAKGTANPAYYTYKLSEHVATRVEDDGFDWLLIKHDEHPDMDRGLTFFQFATRYTGSEQTGYVAFYEKENDETPTTVIKVVCNGKAPAPEFYDSFKLDSNSFVRNDATSDGTTVTATAYMVYKAPVLTRADGKDGKEEDDKGYIPERVLFYTTAKQDDVSDVEQLKELFINNLEGGNGVFVAKSDGAPEYSFEFNDDDNYERYVIAVPVGKTDKGVTFLGAIENVAGVERGNASELTATTVKFKVQKDSGGDSGNVWAQTVTGGDAKKWLSMNVTSFPWGGTSPYRADVISNEKVNNATKVFLLRFPSNVSIDNLTDVANKVGEFFSGYQSNGVKGVTAAIGEGEQCVVYGDCGTKLELPNSWVEDDPYSGQKFTMTMNYQTVGNTTQATPHVCAVVVDDGNMQLTLKALGWVFNGQTEATIADMTNLESPVIYGPTGSGSGGNDGGDKDNGKDYFTQSIGGAYDQWLNMDFISGPGAYTWGANFKANQTVEDFNKANYAWLVLVNAKLDAQSINDALYEGFADYDPKLAGKGEWKPSEDADMEVIYDGIPKDMSGSFEKVPGVYGEVGNVVALVLADADWNLTSKVAYYVKEESTTPEPAIDLYGGDNDGDDDNNLWVSYDDEDYIQALGNYNVKLENIDVKNFMYSCDITVTEAGQDDYDWYGIKNIYVVGANISAKNVDTFEKAIWSTYENGKFKHELYKGMPTETITDNYGQTLYRLTAKCNASADEYTWFNNSGYVITVVVEDKNGKFHVQYVMKSVDDDKNEVVISDIPFSEDKK